MLPMGGPSVMQFKRLLHVTYVPLRCSLPKPPANQANGTPNCKQLYQVATPNFLALSMTNISMILNAHFQSVLKSTINNLKMKECIR